VQFAVVFYAVHWSTKYTVEKQACYSGIFKGRTFAFSELYKGLCEGFCQCRSHRHFSKTETLAKDRDIET